MVPALYCARTLGDEADTTSTCPPSRAVMDSPDDLYGTMTSLVMSTPAFFSGLAMASWMWLPTEVATAMDSESGFFFSWAIRSCTFFSGESARTATSMDSSSSRAMGVISAYDSASGCSTRALIMPVEKVPTQCESPSCERRVCRRTAPLQPGLLVKDRKSVVVGKRVAVRVDIGGRSIINKKK